MKEKPKKRSVLAGSKHKKSKKKLVTGRTEVMDFDLDEELSLSRKPGTKAKAAKEAAEPAFLEDDEFDLELSDPAAAGSAEESSAPAEVIAKAAETSLESETISEASILAATAAAIGSAAAADEAEAAVMVGAEKVPAAGMDSGSTAINGAEAVSSNGAETAADPESAQSTPTEENLNQTWDTMPEKEVSIGDDTMELLGLEELLDDAYGADADGAYGSRAKSSARADYMEFVPKKMTGAFGGSAEHRGASGQKTAAAGSRKNTDSRKSAAVGSPKNAGSRSAGGAAAAATGRKVSGSRSGAAAGRQTGKTVSSGSASRRRKKGGFLSGMDMMDRIIAATGVLVVLVALLTAGIYSTAQSAKKQVAAMAEIGEKMETIGIAGEGIFTAVADARLAALEAAEYAEDSEAGEVAEYEEKELNTEVSVGLKLTSVQRDLKIKFTNKNSGKLIGNQPFEVKIEGPETMTKVDDNEDGIIYIDSIKAGEYTVTITAPEEIDGNKVKGVSALVTVKDQIEYKKIDVADEVKTEAEINAAQEDTAVAVEVESVSTDTVEWVESTKTAIGGSVSYVAVKKADVPDPANTASAAFMKIAAHGAVLLSTLNPGDSSSDNDVNQNPDPGQDPPTVSAVSISGDSSATAGSSVTLSASVTMSDGSAYSGNIEWSYDGQSASGSSISVSANEAKTITVTASAGGQSAQHTVTFTAAAAPAQVQSVSVSASNTSPKVGDKINFTASVTMSDGSSYGGAISWSGAASGSGSTVEVTASAAGTLSVTATADGVSGKLDVTVGESAVKTTSVSLDQTALTMAVGDSKALTATVKPDNATDKTVTWSSSNTAVATVDGSGNVKAVAAGSADITVKTSDGGASAICKVTVNAAAAALSVTLEAPGSMNSGEEKTLKWTTTGDVDTSKTAFTSSNTSLATVDSSGKVKALAKGSVTITVTVTDKSGKTASATGTLTINPAGSVTITLSPSSTTVKVGEKVTITASVTTSGGKGLTWKSGNESVAKITASSDTSCTVEALKAGTVTITATSTEKTDVSASCSVTVNANVDLTAKLKDSAGNQLYVKNGETYTEATVADYYQYDTFYRKQDNAQYLYTGWQNIDGKRYYFDKNGNPVTGDQIIQGMQYSFNSDGSLKVNGSFGIDVSKHNGSIDWNAVKNAGVDFVIIRCGYRGSATGVLVEDPKFKTNIQGATAAGLKVGIYFFSQAVNEVEAVEEASMTISLINKYKITYPVYIDVEAANGRADGMDAATRTKVIKAYCQTIKNSGYTAGIYANKTWLNSKFNVGELGSYKIWLAQYAATPTYNGRYEMWQYSSTGRISGISGNVDLNTSYMSY